MTNTRMNLTSDRDYTAPRMVKAFIAVGDDVRTPSVTIDGMAYRYGAVGAIERAVESMDIPRAAVRDMAMAEMVANANGATTVTTDTYPYIESQGCPVFPFPVILEFRGWTADELRDVLYAIARRDVAIKNVIGARGLASI